MGIVWPMLDRIASKTPTLRSTQGHLEPVVTDDEEIARAKSPSGTAFQRKMLPSVSGGVRADTSNKENQARLSWIVVLLSSLV